MSTDPIADPALPAITRLRQSWGWFVALGIVLMLIGGFAIAHPFLSTLAAVLAFGWILVFSGAAHVVFAFQMRPWQGVVFNVLAGILEVVIGVLSIRKPVEMAAALTLLIAVYLLVGGLFRIGAAIALRIDGAMWLALSGLISAILGVWLITDLPGATAVFIGTVVGIDLLFHGCTWMMLGFMLRRPKAT